jgi:hypothetical protein
LANEPNRKDETMNLQDSSLTIARIAELEEEVKNLQRLIQMRNGDIGVLEKENGELRAKCMHAEPVIIEYEPESGGQQ